MIDFSFQKKLRTASGEMLLDIRHTLAPGSFTILFGESGAGKTSTLRILAGLMLPERGNISVNDNLWLDTSRKINKDPQSRSTGFVFQDYALFPNMTVKENIAFAAGRKKDLSLIAELIEIFELGELQVLKPGLLSGGQKQRVALARALVRRPEILLLDEPLSSIDIRMRAKLQDYILSAHRKTGTTTLMVSHETGEIFKMSDRVIMLENGTVKNSGTPSEIFSNRHISGKFQFTGEVVSIEKDDIIYIVTVLIGNHMVKVIAEESEVKELAIGNKVLVASKAFNPMIRKIG